MSTGSCVVASETSESACEFADFGINFTYTCSNFSSKLLTTSCHLVVSGPVLLDTWHATSCESVGTFGLLTPIAMAISKPLIRASYFASFFIAKNSNMTVVLKERPSKLVRMTPVPTLVDVDDPSIWSSQGRLVKLLGSEGKVSSTMKLVRAWTLIAVRGAYVTPNYPISINHLRHHLPVSGRYRAFSKGRDVRTSTWW